MERSFPVLVLFERYRDIYSLQTMFFLYEKLKPASSIIWCEISNEKCTGYRRCAVAGAFIMRLAMIQMTNIHV